MPTSLGSLEVPLHLRNAPTRLMKEIGYGKGYRYAHDEPGGYAAGERYFPDDMPDRRYYVPAPRGLEIKIGEALNARRERDASARRRRIVRQAPLQWRTFPRKRQTKEFIVLDPKLLRSDLTGVAAALARRGFVLDVAAFAALEEQRKSVQIEADRLRAERNANAKAVGHAKSKGQDAAALLRSRRVLGAAIARRGAAARSHSGAGRWHCSWDCRIFCTPACRTDATRRRMSKCGAGACRGNSTFAPKDHVALGERLGMDFEAAGRISGARFVVMTGELARLHRALAQFMLDLHVARSRLSRSLRALPGARHGAGRHRATAEVRAGSVCRARRSRLLLDSHRRSAADQSGPRSNSCARDACRSNSWRTRRASARRRARPARTRAA